MGDQQRQDGITAQLPVKFKDNGDGTYSPDFTSLSLLAVLSGAGCYATATFAPTAGAYSAGDQVDTPKAMTWYYANGLQVPATAIIALRASVLRTALTGVSSGMTSFTLGLFKHARSAPLSDNAADNLLAIPVEEINNYVDKIALGTLVDVGGYLSVRQNIASSYADIQLEASGLYAELITDSGWTASGSPSPSLSVKLSGVVL